MAFNKNKVMDAARKYVEKGQVDRAIREYRKVVEHDPKDVRVWLKIGDLYAKKGAKAEATETYLKVAKFYSEQGFYLKAVAVYKQILKLDPRMVEVNLKLAELYRQLGLLSDAMQHFERVAAHFHREGKTQEALATIRQLVDLDPDNVATRIKLAELYSKEGMTQEAIAEFRRACDYLREHNRQDDFIKVAERLLWHDNSDIALNRELATLYLRRNDARRALQKLQVCFKADPRDVETLALLAQAFQALDQKSKTVSVLKELARVFTENGQRAEALDVHRKILMFAPDDPDSRAALGEEPPSRPSESIPRAAEVVESAPVRRARTGAVGQPTGSMPLVEAPDEEFELDVDGLSDDASDAFAADIAVDDESFEVPGPAVEANADEIAKILTETDVYVKYGLQQKAIDHLQRVFELDPHNVEARERLKDIFVSDGRLRDAVAELVTLAELVAPQDPARAADYLAEANGLAPGDADVAACARRLGVAVDGGTGVEIVDDESSALEVAVDDLGTGDVAVVEEDDFDFDAYEFGAGGGAAGEGEAELVAEFDDAGEFAFDEVDGAGAEPGYDGLAATAPAAPLPAEPGQVTQEVSLDQLEQEFAVEDEFALEDASVEELAFDSPVAAPDGTTELAVDDIEFEPSDVRDPAADLVRTFDDPRAFDAAPIELDPTDLPSEVPGPPLDAPEHLDPDEDLGIDLAPPRSTQPTAATAQDEPSGTSLEDDLDEADFFVSQGLYDEARDILNGLLGRYPNHPLILAKLQDIDALAAGDLSASPVELGPDPLDPGPIPDDRIESELAARTRDDAQPSRVKLHQEVSDEDADTHFDLGLAYKEMGLYAEAIKSFEKVLDVQRRAVEANLMIGLCHREQGAFAEAVQQFKNGLYVESITEAEKLGLYFEIGVTYEMMDDPSEALYFYEMVGKKEPGYRDVAERIARMKAASKAGNGARSRARAPARADDVDAALDGLIGGGADDVSRS